MLKQALKASSGNLTERHTEDASMCALFLMEAAKKTDREFGCSQSSAHTTNAESDVTKMMRHLMDGNVAQEVPDRNAPAFEEPTQKGLQKMCNTSWIQDTLSKTAALDDDLEVNDDNVEINLDYELADVV